MTQKPSSLSPYEGHLLVVKGTSQMVNPCLSNCAVAVKGYHVQDNMSKHESLLRLTVLEGESMAILVGSLAAGSAGAAAESSSLAHK